MLEIQPFVKIAWNDNATKNQYSDMLEKVKRLSFDAEYEMVKRGLRKANVYHMTPRNFDVEIEKITRDGLVFLPMVRSKSYNGFSHRHYPVNELDFNCFVYGVVAQNLETAQKFCDASKVGDHVTQGELLGYPKCCSEAFQKNWANGVLDPCFEAAINTNYSVRYQNKVLVEGDGLTNVMLRYFGVKVIPFFPCSYTCEEALKVADVWFDLMKSMDSDVAAVALDLLNQPLTWSLYKQIIYISTTRFKGIVNGYECADRKDIIWNAENKETKELPFLKPIEVELQGESSIQPLSPQKTEAKLKTCKKRSSDFVNPAKE